MFLLKSVFLPVASIYSNLLEQKKAFTQEKNLTPTGLLWNTSMAAVTSGKNALLVKSTLGIANDPYDHKVLVPLLFNMLPHVFSAPPLVDHLYH